MEIEVINEQDGHRFAAHVDGHLAKLEYSLDDNELILEHTSVPEEIGGRGVAGALVEAALDWAEAEKLTVVPWCSYTRNWLQHHPYEAGRVKIDWRDPPEDHGPKS
ncbi:MAG: GNAT family N-acetyltransferase [Acidimicrobiia bacterium]